MSFKDQKGQLVKPVFWDDNYLSLLPGETRVVTATLSKKISEEIQFSMEGINLK
jgi:exo-1,4-beta-D-glucosaminidase